MGEFLTVMQTRDEVEGLHICLEINIAFLEKYCYFNLSFTSNLFVNVKFHSAQENVRNLRELAPRLLLTFSPKMRRLFESGA